MLVTTASDRREIQERRVGLIGLGDEELALAEPRVGVGGQAAGRRSRTSGSRPPSASTDAMRLVVVVLPCVPAMAMPCFSRISSASISARGTTGRRARAPRRLRDCRRRPRSRRRPRRRLATFAASWPIATVAPSCARRRVAALSARSEPRHLIALRDEHLGDAAHAGAADADEMHALDLVLHARAPSCDAHVGDALGCVAACPAHARPAPSRAARRAVERLQALARRSAVSSPCGIHRTRRRASTRNRALALCSSAMAPGSGTMIAPTPTAASSATVIAPPRQIDEVAPTRSAPPCRR